MVATGMGGRNPDVTVGIEGDSSGFDNAIASVLGGLDSTREKVIALNGALATLGGVAIAGSVVAANNFNRELRELEKVSDPMQAQQIGEDMQELSERIPLATTKLVDLATQARRFGVEGPDAIGNFVETVSKMSVATDIAADEAGQAFARLSTLTQTPISDIQNLGSSINTLGQNAATSAADIVDGMLRSSGALTQLGLSAEEIIGLQSTLNETSESAERAGTRLRRLAQQLMDPKTVESISGALGLTAEEFSQMVESDPTAVIKELARTMNEGGEAADTLKTNLTTVSRVALTALGSNLEETTGNLELANQAFEEGTSLTKEFEIEASSLDGKVQQLKNSVFNLAEEIGQGYIPYLKDAVETTDGAFGAFSRLNQMSDGLAGQILTLTTAVAGLRAALALLGVGSGSTIAAVVAAAGTLWIAWDRNIGGIKDITRDAVETVGNLFEDFFEWLPGFSDQKMKETTDDWEDWAINAMFGIQVVTQAVVQLYEWAKLTGQTLQMMAEGGLQGLSIFGDPLGIMSDNAMEEIRNMAESSEQWEQNIRRSGSSFGERLQNLRQLAEEARAMQADLIRSPFDEAMGRTRNDLPISSDGDSTPFDEALEDEGGGGPSQPRMPTTPEGMAAMTDPMANSLLEEQNKKLDEIRDATGRTASATEGILGPFEKVPRPCRESMLGAMTKTQRSGSVDIIGAAADPAAAGLPPGRRRRETSNPRSQYGTLPGGSAAHGPGNLTAGELERAIENSLNVQAEVTLDGKRVSEGMDRAQDRYRKRRLVE